MAKVYNKHSSDGTTMTVVASIPTEDIIVRSSVGYIPQFVTEVYGKTKKVTKVETLTKLLRMLKKDFSEYSLHSIGTPVNFDFSPTHLTRVEMKFDRKDQVEKCLKEISASDMLIRSRVQPMWDWQGPASKKNGVVLHVGWYDPVYFMQFKDIFLSDLHCRYSAKFNFDPKDANITHFRYDEHGDIEEIVELNDSERHAESIKHKVEFLRIFRDGTQETT
jgi:hypothetical protein